MVTKTTLHEPPCYNRKMQRQNSLRNLPRNVWVVTLTSFFTDVSSEMLINLIPFFLANVLGVRTAYGLFNAAIGEITL